MWYLAYSNVSALLGEIRASLQTFEHFNSVFLRELTEPVIPFDMYDAFLRAFGTTTHLAIEDYNERLCELKTLVQKLPPQHYAFLEYLMRHLLLVSTRSEVNKMEPPNLAIVFGYRFSNVGHHLSDRILMQMTCSNKCL